MSHEACSSSQEASSSPQATPTLSPPSVLRLPLLHCSYQDLGTVLATNQLHLHTQMIKASWQAKLTMPTCENARLVLEIWNPDKETKTHLPVEQCDTHCCFAA